MGTDLYTEYIGSISSLQAKDVGDLSNIPKVWESSLKMQESLCLCMYHLFVKGYLVQKGLL